MANLAKMIDAAMEEGVEAINIFYRDGRAFVAIRRKGSTGWQCDQEEGGKPSEHLVAALTQRRHGADDLFGDLL